MIDFPASPTDGQMFGAPNGIVYKWSATYSSWLVQNPAPAIGGTGDFCAFTTAALGSAGNVVIAFPSVFSGNAGNWYNPANGRYTPPAGRYKLSTWWSCNYSGSAIQLAVDAIRKNGVAIPNTSSISGTIAANYNTAVNSEVIVDANGSDYFEVTAYASAWTAGRGWFMAFPLTGMQGPLGPAGGSGSSKLLQTVYNRTGTGGTGTTIIPFDTTIPQITEGDEYMTLAITPTSATSLLIIDVVWIGSSSAVNNMGVALFKDATASALTAAAATVTAANATVNIKFKYIMVSGSTAATTFRVRAGGGAAGTTSFNSGTTFGFVMCSSMTIQEVTP